MDFSGMVKNAMGNVMDAIKKKLALYGLIALGILLILIILIGIIATLFGYESEEENESGTYNPRYSYGFWWPIGGREITTDENGNEYAIGDPSAIGISSDYKSRNPDRPDHNGIDIHSVDTDGIRQGEGYHYIIAAKDGAVLKSYLSTGEHAAGEYIIIQHENGLVTKYMHMYEESRRVQEGDLVKQGQIIGIMGNTGNSTGPHLHFQIELNGIPVDPLEYISSDHPRGGAGADIFDTSISEEDFIQSVSNYKKDDLNYQSKMVGVADLFYNICVDDYGINPKLAFAHSCLETDYGNYFIANNNYFGYAAYNSNPNGASSYLSPEDSIKQYCEWVMNNVDPSTSAYQANLARADELSPYNQMLLGTPETNIYVLYIRYAQLDATHEAGADGGVKYLGTHYMTKAMYGTMCDHPIGSETTLQEKADYAVYTTDKRLQIIENIFGK